MVDPNQNPTETPALTPADPLSQQREEAKRAVTEKVLAPDHVADNLKLLGVQPGDTAAPPDPNTNLDHARQAVEAAAAHSTPVELPKS